MAAAADGIGRATETLVAVNVGGCVIPALLVALAVVVSVDDPAWTLIACATIRDGQCQPCAISRPRLKWGSGVAVPAFVPPLTAV